MGSSEEDDGVAGGGDGTGEEEDIDHDLVGGGGGDDSEEEEDFGDAEERGDGGDGAGENDWDSQGESSSAYDSDASATSDYSSDDCVSGEHPDVVRSAEMRAANDLHGAAFADHASPVVCEGDLGETLCAKVLDYLDEVGDEERCRAVYEDNAPTDTFAFVTPSLRDVFANACTMSETRIAAAHQMCLSVERATGSTTLPFKVAFPTPSSLKTAVRNEKRRMLRKLGWMEAVVTTKVGSHRILLRKGLKVVQECLTAAATVRWERGSEDCACAAGVHYSQDGSQNGPDAVGRSSQDVDPGTTTPTSACAHCTPSVATGDIVPASPVMQDGDVLRDFFDGHAYGAQRADVKRVFGLCAQMLALALYSDGTVVTSSGGTFSHWD